MDKFLEMSIFVAVADAQGFAAAARQLNLSAPGVTRAVAAMESRIGTLLLTRNTRSVRLTESGQRFYADCRRILQEIDEASEHVAGLDAPPHGLLTITAPVLFGERFITPFILEFLREYPQLTIKSLFTDRIVNLVDEAVDVAIRIVPLASSAQLAGHVSRIVCAAPALLQAQGTPLKPQDLSRYRLIHAAAIGEWNFIVDNALSTLDISSPLSLSSNRAAIAAAAQGWGITRVMSYQVAEELKTGALQRILTEYELPPVPIYVISPEGRNPSPKVTRFMEFCVSKLRANPALNQAVSQK